MLYSSLRNIVGIRRWKPRTGSAVALALHERGEIRGSGLSSPRKYLSSENKRFSAGGAAAGILRLHHFSKTALSEETAVFTGIN